jgi:hypothetical protein
VNEVNSSPDEIGHGAIPAVVGIVQGDEVGDGPVASHTFRGGGVNGRYPCSR